MQLASTPQITRHVLIVDSGLNGNGHTTAATRGVRALATELHGRGMDVIESTSCEDGIATAQSDASIDCILINWTQGENDLKVHNEATELMRSVRTGNSRLRPPQAERDITTIVSAAITRKQVTGGIPSRP